MRRSRGRRSSPASSVILVLLLITALAIASGYFLSTFLISSFTGRNPVDKKPGDVVVQPNTNTPQSTPSATTPATNDPNTSVPASTVTATPTLPSVLYGQVQLGAFAQESNATNLAATLNQQGFPASIIKRDNLYRVVVGVFAERSIAEEYKKSLEDKGNKDIHLSSAEIHLTAARTYQGDEADLVKVLGSLVSDAANVTSKLLQVSDQLYDKSVSQAVWKQSVGSLTDQVIELEKVQLPAVQSPLVNQWGTLVAGLKEHVTNLAGRSVGDLAAWTSSQVELARILNDLQALYTTMGR